MTVSSVGSSQASFHSLATSRIDEGEFNSVSGQLAVLMLNSQEQQKEVEREQLASARADYKSALADEVSALREQADAQFRGALVQGSISIASAGFGLAHVRRNVGMPPGKEMSTWQGETSKGLGQLAQPLGAMVGNTYGAADAKSAQGVEESAKWRMDDARDAKKDAEALQNKALDWASSMVDRDAATTASILSNKV
jgi:hypothetical protein